MFKTKIIHTFDKKQFDLFWEDSKHALFRNLWYDFTMTEEIIEIKYNELLNYYMSFFGVKAKLSDKFVFVVYDDEHPDHDLLYCAGKKIQSLSAIEFGISMTRKNKNNSKYWIKRYFSSADSILKPLITSLGMSRWYLAAYNNGDFVKKSLFSNENNHKINVIEKSNGKETVISSAYGWN